VDLSRGLLLQRVFSPVLYQRSYLPARAGEGISAV
jgi:hypothetical protein